MLEDWLASRPDDAFKKTILPIIRPICQLDVKSKDIDTSTILGRMVYYIKAAIEHFEEKMNGNDPGPIKFLPDMP